MKKLFKIGAIVFVAVIALLIAVAALGGGDAQRTSEPAKVEETKEKPQLPGKPEYEAIEEGMTRDEVEALFGKVQVDMESVTEYDGIKSELIVYKAKGDFGSSISVTYTNGTVELKSSFELE